MLFRVRMVRSGLPVICQGACKPGSVARTVSPRLPLSETVSALAAIPLGLVSPPGSSNQPGRSGPKQTCPALRQGAPPLFGLAPGGVCRAVPVTRPPVRSYRTLSPLPRKRGGLLSVALSLGFAANNSPGGRYPPPLFRGARTFLAVLANPAAARPPGGWDVGDGRTGSKPFTQSHHPWFAPG
ncbi:MAG: hypothetical protein RL339_2217 [Pseudomonadota bacterium]